MLHLTLLTMTLAAATPEAPTLDDKIGQMFMLGFRGTELDDEAPIIRQLRERNIGGVVLFSKDVPTGSHERNIVSPDQLRRLITRLQEASPQTLLIALDQEGGFVRRLDERFGASDIRAAKWYGQRDEPIRTRRDAKQTAKILKGLGINLNFAPVVDLDINPQSPALGRWGRSFGRASKTVVRHATAVVKAHRSEGVATVLKHFPGHGSALGDSHRGFTDATEAWSRVELEPFSRMIRAGDCDAVMMGHLFIGGLDPEHPATLSKRVVDGVLRTELGFDGVVITDDLQMNAIRQHYGLRGAILLAVQAGVDIMMFANNSVYDEEVGDRVAVTLKNLVIRGEIDRSRIDESYQRITKLKRWLQTRGD